MVASLRRIAEVAWFLILTGLNELNWRLFKCEWSHPYEGEVNGKEMV